MAAEYGDDIQVIFVESQRRMGADGVEAFIWDHKWMGTSAMWTGEAPVRTGARGLPNFALLSSDGELLLTGHPGSMHGKIEDAIAADLKKANAIPEGTPKALKKAWKAAMKGDYGKAVAEARKIEAKGGADGEGASAAITTFIGKVEAELARADWMVQNGYLAEAQEFLKKLSKRIKGIEDVAEKANELNGHFTSEDNAAELAASVELSKLINKLAEDGFDDKLVKKLNKFVKKNEATKAAERAAHLAKISEKV